MTQNKGPVCAAEVRANYLYKPKCRDQLMTGVSFRARSINWIDPAGARRAGSQQAISATATRKTVVPRTVDVLFSCMPEFPAARMCATPSAPIDPITEPRINAKALPR